MPAGGSQKGERRGGRQKGALNKKTIERKVKEDAERIMASGQPVKMLGKEIIEQFAHYCAGYASKHQPKGERPGLNTPTERAEYDWTVDQFERWMRLAGWFAKELAPYQSPTFRAIAIVTPPEDGGRKVTRFTLNIFEASDDDLGRPKLISVDSDS